MTSRQAIRETKKLWRRLEELGVSKVEYVEMYDDELAVRVRSYRGSCPLCEYTSKNHDCDSCPFVTQYDERCAELGYDSRPNARFMSAVKGLKE